MVRCQFLTIFLVAELAFSIGQLVFPSGPKIPEVRYFKNWILSKPIGVRLIYHLWYIILCVA